jgi:hypothetical protein
MNPPPPAVQYVLTDAKHIQFPARCCICGVGLTAYATHEPVVCRVGAAGQLEPLCRKCAAKHAPTLAALRAPLMDRLLTFAGLRAWLAKWLRLNRP